MPNADMKFVLTILTSLTIVVATGQNLVPNGSFETYTTCPAGWAGLNNNIDNWYPPTSGTPDAYDTCGNFAFFGVPQNPFGYQYAKSGYGYAGIGMSFSQASANYREYLQVKFTDTLLPNKKYVVSFFVNKADSAPIVVTKLGAYISNTAYIDMSMDTTMPLTPQILSSQNIYLRDSANWVEITDTITSLGTEQYLTIGYFQNNAHADTLRLFHATPSLILGLNSDIEWQAYYYIDDVTVLCLDCITNFIAPVSSSIKNNIYPNPTSDQSTLHFDNTKKEVCTLTLYNHSGQIMRTINNITSDQVVIQKNDLQNGLYYFVLRTSDRVIVTGKLAVD